MEMPKTPDSRGDESLGRARHGLTLRSTSLDPGLHGAAFQIALERMRRIEQQPARGFCISTPSISGRRYHGRNRFRPCSHPGYYTVRRSFEPVLASIEYDRDRWKPGEAVRCSLWAINDRWDAVPNARIEWRIENGSGKVAASGDFGMSMPPDSSQKVGAVEWTAEAAGAWVLRATVLDSVGGRISENLFEFEVR